MTEDHAVRADGFCQRKRNRLRAARDAVMLESAFG